jgi:hypothetical protein
MDPDTDPYLNADTDSDLATQFHADPTVPGSATLVLAQVMDSTVFLTLPSSAAVSAPWIRSTLVLFLIAGRRYIQKQVNKHFL